MLTESQLVGTDVRVVCVCGLILQVARDERQRSRTTRCSRCRRWYTVTLVQHEADEPVR